MYSSYENVILVMTSYEDVSISYAMYSIWYLIYIYIHIMLECQHILIYIYNVMAFLKYLAYEVLVIVVNYIEFPSGIAFVLT